MAAGIALWKPEFDMETRRVDSTKPKEVMLVQNSPFNDLEVAQQMLVAIQPETPQITRTQMLPENSPFNDLEDWKLFCIIADSIPP